MLEQALSAPEPAQYEYVQQLLRYDVHAVVQVELEPVALGRRAARTRKRCMVRGRVGEWSERKF